jgi:hypothetical protein
VGGEFRQHLLSSHFVTHPFAGRVEKIIATFEL